MSRLVPRPCCFRAVSFLPGVNNTNHFSVSSMYIYCFYNKKKIARELKYMNFLFSRHE